MLLREGCERACWRWKLGFAAVGSSWIPEGQMMTWKKQDVGTAKQDCDTKEWYSPGCLSLVLAFSRGNGRRIYPQFWMQDKEFRPSSHYMPISTFHPRRFNPQRPS